MRTPFLILNYNLSLANGQFERHWRRLYYGEPVHANLITRVVEVLVYKTLRRVYKTGKAFEKVLDQDFHYFLLKNSHE